MSADRDFVSMPESNPSLESQTDDEAIRHIGELVDRTREVLTQEACAHGIKICNEWLQKPLTPSQAALLNYYTANAWANLHELHRTERVWEWEQPELEKQILHLRVALMHDGFASLERVRQCQIRVNLGNLLSHVGRFVDSLPYWQRAASDLPDFGMALGNLGMGLLSYACYLSSQEQQLAFSRQAKELLDEATSLPLFEDARSAFRKRSDWIASYVASREHREIDFDGHTLGSSEEEVRYRMWCLRERLFLNPLNDLTDRSLAAQDVLSAPSIVVALNEGPYYAGFFDQLKQEFVSARFLLWESKQARGPHYSDRRVPMVNTLDYPAYGLYAEKLRASFRLAYSVLDKIAVFLNHYLRLGIDYRGVHFRSVWYGDGKQKNGLHDCLVSIENLPLRGLYWLSRDLFEDKPGFRDSLEPEGKDLSDIRNCLEHRYLKLHLPDWSGSRPESWLADPLAYSVRVSDLQDKSVKLLTLVRSALLYLAFSVRSEEAKRARSRPTDKIVPASPLHRWEDDWKCPL